MGEAKLAYGIMAVHTLQGLPSDCDEVFFDGWYLYRKHAEEIFELFKKRYPHANVFIVEQLKAEWRGKHARLPDDVRNARLETHRATCGPRRLNCSLGSRTSLSRSLSCHQPPQIWGRIPEPRRFRMGGFRRRNADWNRRFKRNSTKFRRTNFVTGRAEFSAESPKPSRPLRGHQLPS
jgi:hypothetical protein